MVHFFDSEIAQKYGVNAAVLACFLWDCIEEQSTQSPQLHEGKVWIRCSVQMMTGFFPFLTYDEVRYAFKQLSTRAVLTVQTGTLLLNSDNFLWQKARRKHNEFEYP